MRAVRWLLVEEEGGKVEVRRNDRTHSSWPSLDAAKAGIAKYVQPVDRVTRQETDGYRVKDGVHRRRGWRK